MVIVDLCAEFLIVIAQLNTLLITIGTAYVKGILKV